MNEKNEDINIYKITETEREKDGKTQTDKLA